MIININKKKIFIRVSICGILLFTIFSLFFKKSIYTLNILMIVNIIITVSLFIDNSFNIIQLELGKPRKEIIKTFNYQLLIIMLYNLFFIIFYLFLQLIINQSLSFHIPYIIKIYQLCIITSLLIYISLMYNNIIKVICLLFITFLIILEHFLISIIYIITLLLILLFLYILIIYVIKNKKIK